MNRTELLQVVNSKSKKQHINLMQNLNYDNLSYSQNNNNINSIYHTYSLHKCRLLLLF